MKFWQKTFLATLALFLIAFDIGIFMIANLSYKNSMQSEEQKDLGEHYFISMFLTKDISAIEQRGVESDAALRALCESYGNYYKKQNTNLEVIKDEMAIYSNIPAHGGERGETVLQEGMRNTVMRTVGDSQYLYIAGALPEPYGEYTLIYAKNLDFIVTAQEELTRTLLAASVMISLALAAALYFLLRHLSKPIRKLTETTRRIAAGEYGERVAIEGEDEFAQLGGSFNDMAEEIEFQMGSLARASKQKQQFIDNLAHELRTPLTTIHGYAEYIQKAVITEDDKIIATGYIMNESSRLKEVAYKLMDMAVLRESGIQTTEIDIFELVESAVATADGNALRKGVKVKTDIQQINFKGDRDLLQSLIINMVDNAIKACNQNGRILVKTYYNDDGNAVISITDNGQGMTKEQLGYITQPFYRVDKARSREHGGAGLGLSLCKQIAECHNAEIEFSSIYGKGTTVRIIFYTSITRLLEDDNTDELL